MKPILESIRAEWRIITAGKTRVELIGETLTAFAIFAAFFAALVLFQ